MPPFWKQLKPPFFVLAPMADVTNVVFRNFLLHYSRPEVVYTEFMACKALLTPQIPASLQRALWFSESERPIVAQVFGAEPAEMFAGAQRIRRLGFDGMDINMGCPDRRVEKQGVGARLIRDPPNRTFWCYTAAPARNSRRFPRIGTRLPWRRGWCMMTDMAKDKAMEMGKDQATDAAKKMVK